MWRRVLLAALLAGVIVAQARTRGCLEDRGWLEEHFAGPVPEAICRSQNGHLRLVRILGTRRWRHAGPVHGVAFSPDGKRAVSGSGDDTLKLWDVETGKLLDSIVADGGPKSVAVRRGLALSGNVNSTVTVYRLR